MEKIRVFLEKNKTDVFNVIALSILFLITFFIKVKTPFSLMDLGREVYIPQQIIQGKVLYKDIFMMHPPFSYQINAILFQVFGTSFKILFSASVCNCYLITMLVYFITRQFIQSNYSLPVSVFITTIAFYYEYCPMSYVWPYSYGMIYGLVFFLFFVLFSIKYLKLQEDNSLCVKYAHMAGLFIGLAGACKQDFLFAYIPLFVFILKKTNIKSILANLLFFVFPLSISFGVLFLNGLQQEDIISFLSYQSSLIKTSAWYFYTFCTDENLFVAITKKIVFFVISLMFWFGYFGVNTILIKKIVSRFSLKNLLYFISFFLINLLIFFLIYKIFFLFFLIICLPLPILCFYQYKRENKDKQIFLFLSILPFLLTIREFFMPYRYGYFVFILPLILILVFVFQSKVKKETLKAFSICLLMFSLILCINKVFFKVQKNIELKTTKGSIYMTLGKSSAYKSLIDWIEQNTNSSDRILVFPEAPLINFITDRLSDNKYYQLSPDHIEAFGEKQIVADLSKKPPEYIVLQKIIYDTYGVGEFGVDFGREITEYIFENYSMINSIENKGFWLYVYKLNH